MLTKLDLYSYSFQKMSAYRTYFDKSKFVSFLIEDEQFVRKI